MELQTLIEQSTKRVEEQNNPYYWTADGYRFDNKNLALWYEKDTGHFTTFVDSQLDVIRGHLSTAIDMDRNYNRDYLQYLKSTYSEVHLFFSGGADSVTILDTAVQNNIELDKLICLTCDDLSLECNREIRLCAMPVAEKHNYEIVSTSYDQHAEAYRDPLAFFRISGAVTTQFRSALDVNPNIVYQPNVVYVKGSDKPQMLKYKDQWYAVFIDSQMGGDYKNPNVKCFWLDAFNIKSYVKDALLYREYLQNNDLVKPGLQFFKPSQDPKIGIVLGRSKVVNDDAQHAKNEKYVSSKAVQRVHDAIDQNHYDLLINYYTAKKTFNSILPDFDTDSGKFAWLIDMDTLEVYTQKQLIPNGFEGV
jgi:hypothetical protein